MTPPKPLTEAERAAVDAAIAAGRFQRIPLGVYAECQINPVPVREQIRRQANNAKAGKVSHNARIAEAAAERRIEALRLHGEGLTPAEIAGRMELSLSAVYRHIEYVRAGA